MQMLWRHMPEFAGVDLEDSRILGWRSEPGRLVIELQVRLLPEHPDYAAPLFDSDPSRGAGSSCDRPARLVFDEVAHVDGLHPPMSAFLDEQDAAPRLDTLAWLRREDDGSYQFDATWGTIRVYSATIRLDLDAPHRVAA